MRAAASARRASGGVGDSARFLEPRSEQRSLQPNDSLEPGRVPGTEPVPLQPQ